MGAAFRMPIIGKIGQQNTKKMFFHTEEIPLDVPRGLRGTTLLFLTDPHIGGSIDAIIPEVNAGMKQLLMDTDPTKTLILHGGDFISGHSGTFSPTGPDITKVASELFAGLTSYPHFAVVGNHDEEDPDFPRMRKHLEDQFGVHFMTSPKDTQLLTMGENTILIHGIHTLLDHLQTI